MIDIFKITEGDNLKKDREKHLPVIGVGPIYVLIILFVTVVGILLSKFNYIKVISFGFFKIPNLILGIFMIFIGIFIWIKAVIVEKIDDGIKNNKLVTTGIYACVRNPIYSAFMIAFTGILLTVNNVLLLVLPVAYWLFLTIFMKHTEEKWLKDLYGEEYENYCKKVNRCIPWFPQK